MHTKSSDFSLRNKKRTEENAKAWWNRNVQAFHFLKSLLQISTFLNSNRKRSNLSEQEIFARNLCQRCYVMTFNEWTRGTVLNTYPEVKQSELQRNRRRNCFATLSFTAQGRSSNAWWSALSRETQSCETIPAFVTLSSRLFHDETYDATFVPWLVHKKFLFTQNTFPDELHTLGWLGSRKYIAEETKCLCSTASARYCKFTNFRCINISVTSDHGVFGRV